LLKATGNVGIGTWAPTCKLDVDGDIRASGGLVVGSSRDLKFDIEELQSEDALKALLALNPVNYRYKADLQEKRVGFIAEKVPELVAMNDHQGLSTMDIVAALTKVVQEQRKNIDKLRL